MGQWTSDGEHIWLRQSVRFTVGDQERTVEIAVPLRPGASADEIEHLLAEAGAGMERLTTHLNARVAAVMAASAFSAPVSSAGLPSSTPESSAVAPVPRVAAARDSRDTTTTGTRSASGADTAPIAAAAAPSAAAPADDLLAHDRRATERRPTPAPAAPPAPPQRVAERRESEPSAAARAAAPTRPPAPARPTTPPAAIDRRTFLAETQAIGLNPRQVMDSLGVRSLDGINYGEALETLRRQHLRAEAGGTASGSAASGSAESRALPARAHAPVASASDLRAPAASPRAGAPGAARASMPPPPAARPGYFEEEEDLDVTPEMEAELDDDLALEDDLEDDDEPGPGVDDYGEGAEEIDGDVDEDDGEDIETIPLDALGTLTTSGPDLPEEFDDVPDFAAPTAPPSPRRAADTATPDPVALAANGLDTLRRRARARELIERFRGLPKTGAPQDKQLSSYKHAVCDQIGADAAAFLTRALFRTPPERTSRDQLQELISWSKEDAFADEATDVLALLRSARSTAAAEPDAPPAASRPPRASRSLSTAPRAPRPHSAARDGAAREERP